MSEFDNRERAFEKKFELDEEQRFKVSSHAAYLFGLWLASTLDLSGADAEAYAQAAVSTVLLKSGHTLLIAKAETDLKAQNISMNRAQLEKEFAIILKNAEADIKG